MQIEISFDRWKDLTALLRDEDDSYDAVIERLLAGDVRAAFEPNLKVPQSSQHSIEGGSGAFFKDISLPNGTELRSTYKGKTYFAKIIESQWVDTATGQTRTSPSQAAYSITGKNVNGWLFWLVRRPGEEEWRSLNALRTMKP